MTIPAEYHYMKANKLRAQGNVILSEHYYLLAFKKNPSLENYKLSLIAALIFQKKQNKLRALYAYQQAYENSTSDDIKNYAYEQIQQYNKQQTIIDENAQLTTLEVHIPKIKLSNVIGLESAKAKLNVSLIKPIVNSERYKSAGLQLSAACLLFGAPGVGKTYIAEALAGEANVNYAYVNIGEVFGMYAGVTEKNMITIFTEAKKKCPHNSFF